MDIQKLYKACLEDKISIRISATTIRQFVKSPFYLHCEKFAPKEKKDPITEYHKMLFEQAKKHEDAVVDEAYPEMIPLKYVDKKDGFWKVLEAMRDGVGVIRGGPLFYLPEGLYGEPDILEKDDSAPSVFGDYHYTVKDVKLAKNLKDYHLLPTAYYNYLIGKIQGFTPSTYFLINRDHVISAHEYVEHELVLTLEGVKGVLQGNLVEPTYGACEWPWETYCNEEARKRNDVSLVTGVGPVRKKTLVAVGCKTVVDLANTSVSKLTSMHGIGKLTADKLTTCAKALCSGKPIPIGPVNLPRGNKEIFLDLEGTGQQVGDTELIDMDYLIGVLVREKQKVTYSPFLSPTLKSEKAMFQKFVAWLTKQKDFIIYHWHHYEKTHLKSLAESYRLTKKAERLLFDNMRDLYKDATAAYAFPSYGNGLKEVATCLGFQWRHKDVSALESIAFYLRYVQDPKKNKDKIQKVIDYNEDDCRATMFVKDWLLSHSAYRQDTLSVSGSSSGRASRRLKRRG